jgi:hypothetical protein
MFERRDHFRNITIIVLAGVLAAGGLLPPIPFCPEASASTSWALPGEDGFNGPGAAFDNTTVAGKGQNASVVMNVTGDWLQAFPDTSPPARDSAAISSIGDAGNVLLFGGSSGTTVLNDTWLFDPAKGAWTLVETPASPGMRNSAAMAPVGNDDKAVLFGGFGYAPGIGDDTWVFDLSDLEWRLVEPTTRPPARYCHAMASFSNDPRVILFGGQSWGGDPMQDTWLFNAASGQWSEVTRWPSPAARSHSAMAGRPGTDEAVLFGGVAYGWDPQDDTWVFDIGDMQWRQASPATRPEARDSHSMAALPGTGRVLLYGGYMSGSFNPNGSDTWSYDAGNDSWSLLSVSDEPSRRYQTGMAPLAGGRVLLFGGSTPGGWSKLGETWIYDANALAPAGAYRSPCIDAGEPANLLTFYWNGTLPPGSRIDYQLRAAGSLEALAQTAFTGPDGTAESFYTLRYNRFPGYAVERWLQFRMVFSSGDRLQSPALEHVEVGLDKLPRAPAPLSPANGGWTNLSRPEFTWTFSDGDSDSQGAFELQLSPTGRFDADTLTSGIIKSPEASYTPPDGLGDGDWYWKVRTRDPEGSWGPFSVTAHFGLDTEPPQDVLVEAEPAGWSEWPFVLNFSTSDGFSGLAGYDLWVDGTDLGPVKAPHVLAGMADGVHEAVVRAVDRAGNRASGSCKLYVDRDPPLPFTPVADPPGWTSRPVQVGYSTGDAGSGVARYEVRLDGGEFSARPSPWALPELSDGVHSVTVRAYDRLGHHSDGTVSVHQDRLAPSGLAVTGAPGGWTASAPVLGFSARDNLSGLARFEMSVNSGGWSIVASPCVPRGLVDGNNSVALRAFDGAGNSAGTLVTILLDRTDPGPFEPAADPPGWTNRPLVRFTAADNGSGVGRYEAQVDAGPSVSAESPFAPKNLTDGRHLVTVRAFDRAGNSAVGSVEVLFDGTPPAASLKMVRGPGGARSSEVTLSITASDPDSGVARMCFSNDGRSYSAWEPFNSTKAWKLSSGEGQKRVYMKVADNAGNEAPAVSATARLEGAPPVSVSAAVAISAAVLLAAAFLGWRAFRRARRGA